MKFRTPVFFIIAVLAGFFLGRSCMPHHRQTKSGDAPQAAVAVAKQVWTCSMHPQIRLDKPGNCPICEMPLILADTQQAGTGAVPSLALSDSALAMAHVQTTPVVRRASSHQLRSVGKIEYDETSLATVTARVDGYAERLFVDFTGVDIKAGDHLADIYSPAIVVAQQELLTAMQGSPEGLATPMAQSTRIKLLRWGLTANQIQELAEKKTITDRVTLYSPISGTVIEKSIIKNSAFKEGDVLYKVANLDTVWAYVDIYEYDFPWIRYGQKVELTAEALPDRTFEGRVTFVQPLVNDATRTIRIPVYVENKGHLLKPGMFVSATIASRGLMAPSGVEGMFSCPMHPQVLNRESGNCPYCGMRLVEIPGALNQGGKEAASTLAYACSMHCEGDKTYDKPGNCPVCGMKLVAVSVQSVERSKEPLAVPMSAVLDSGTRKLVYVEKDHGLFEPRDVVLGPRADGFYPVLRGLSEGDRVVTHGGFLIDSQFQITGQSSLFYPGGLSGDASDARQKADEKAATKSSAEGHSHAPANQSGDDHAMP